MLNRVSLFKSNNDELNELIENMPPYLTIIIVEDTIDKRRRFTSLSARQDTFAI